MVAEETAAHPKF